MPFSGWWRLAFPACKLSYWEVHIFNAHGRVRGACSHLLSSLAHFYRMSSWLGPLQEVRAAPSLPVFTVLPLLLGLCRYMKVTSWCLPHLEKSSQPCKEADSTSITSLEGTQSQQGKLEQKESICFRVNLLPLSTWGRTAPTFHPASQKDSKRILQ